MGKPKTTKKPRIGKDDDKSTTAKKMKKHLLKKAERKEGKKALTENVLIANFIKVLIAEKYTEANKYLQKIINLKLQAKIAASIEGNLF